MSRKNKAIAAPTTPMKDKYDVPLRKKIGGVGFVLKAYASNKTDAVSKATRARENGMKARIIKRAKGKYLVYGKGRDD